MIDVITYCSNTAALVAAVRSRWPDRLDESDPENPRFNLDKTPTVRNGAETLAVVRCMDGQPGHPGTLAALQELESAGVLTVLGTWDEVQADPARKALYDSVYPRTPVTWTDENGDAHTLTPPEEFGRIA